MNQGAINAFAINSAPQGVNIDADLLLYAGSNSNAFAINDYYSPVADSVSYWKLEADTTGSGTYVELPCQYFKATAWSYRSSLPFGGTNYIECLVPSATAYLSTINDAQSFRIKVFYQSGTTQEHVWFNFSSYLAPPIPLTKEFLNASNQDACVIKGAFRNIEPIEEILSFSRALSGIRQNSVTADGRRVVCNLDPILLPSMTVTDGTNTFPALTVSYYVSATDQYMEVFSYSV